MAKQPELSVEGCAGLLRRSRLRLPSEVDELEQLWRREAREPAGAQGFARWLVARRYLTPYQAATLLQGRADRFFLGDYKLLDRVGQGRLALVYMAVHRLGQVAALKVLPPSRSRDPSALARFRREAEVGLSLAHPNIVRILEAGESAPLHFRVMEFLEGETLQHALDARGRFSPAEAAGVGLQVPEALAAVAGLMARDPAQRYQTPAEASTALRAFLEAEPAQPADVELVAVPPPLPTWQAEQGATGPVFEGLGDPEGWADSSEEAQPSRSAPRGAGADLAAGPGQQEVKDELDGRTLRFHRRARRDPCHPRVGADRAAGRPPAHECRRSPGGGTGPSGRVPAGRYAPGHHRSAPRGPVPGPALAGRHPGRRPGASRPPPRAAPGLLVFEDIAYGGDLLLVTLGGQLHLLRSGSLKPVGVPPATLKGALLPNGMLRCDSPEGNTELRELHVSGTEAPVVVELDSATGLAQRVMQKQEAGWTDITAELVWVEPRFDVERGL